MTEENLADLPRVGMVARVAIFLIINRRKFFTVDDVSEGTGMSRITVYQALHHLVKKYPSLFKKEGRGAEAKYAFVGVFGRDII